MGGDDCRKDRGGKDRDVKDRGWKKWEIKEGVKERMGEEGE